MPMIESPCKVCGRAATAYFDDDDPQEAVDKFLPLLTHDRCFDLISKRNKSGALILEVCFEYARTPDNKKGKVISETRETLMAATLAYAEALCGLLNAPKLMWTEDFADLLIEKPTSCIRILKDYRDAVRREARKPQ